MLSPARALLRRSARNATALAVSRQSALSTSAFRQQPATPAQADGGAPRKRRGTRNPIVSPSDNLESRRSDYIVAKRPDSTSLPELEARWTQSAVYLRRGSAQSGPQVKLHASTIRDGCRCSACRDPSSGQKSFATPHIENAISIENVRQTDQGLAVVFGGNSRAEPGSVRLGEHETTLSWEAVELALGVRSRHDADVPPPHTANVLRRTGVVHWDKDVLSREVRKIDYEEYMQGGEAMWDAVVDLCRFGIVFLKNVPRDEDSIVKITTRIANIRETFYGRTFDVVAKPNAENVAYTSGYLGLHQDLLYLAPPPKIQILHCMDNSCEGGESLFSDADRVGRLMWSFKDTHAVRTLAKMAVPYAYNKNGYNYEHFRPLINVDAQDNYRNVFWSPPFQGRFSPRWNIRPFLSPARLFEELINEEDAVYKAKMQPGECVLFDNIRVMHGRTAFDAAGGSRWLRGAYIAEEDFRSKASQIPRELADKYRASPGQWSPRAAEEELSQSKWHAAIQKRMNTIGGGVMESAGGRTKATEEEQV
ncbi:hypothetical protein K4F52_005504 [Lecanicillium sp. MT-2017a]|nr:hypothetical protein K4F52_005504 [Lecanicillium sp. MT-2017a]